MSVVRKCYLESFRCENLISADRMADDKTSVCLQSEDVLEFLARKKKIEFIRRLCSLQGICKFSYKRRKFISPICTIQPTKDGYG